MLRCNPNPPSQCLSLLYHSGKFSKQYAGVIARTVQQILHELSFGNKQQLGHIECMSAEEKVRILKWNPRLPEILPNCVHYLVGSTMEKHPGCEAVCSWDGSLTYEQLDQFSSNLAACLVVAGAKIGDYVPFTFEKSMWAVVAALAILKAGAAFVPLDPSHPRVRLKEILKSTNAKIVVTSNSLGHLFEDLDKRVIPVSLETIDLHPRNDVALPSVQPSDPVFALFTSGSTGQPKGMIHTHGAICTYFLTHGELMGYHKSRVFQFSAYTFDAAILDIFTTLIFGGCVCVPSEEDRLSNITGVMNEMKVDFALLTPSFASLIAPDNVPSLKNLCVAGESLTQGVIDRWAGKVRLMNAYGPAEVGICFLIDVGSDTRAETIGHPLQNCSCWLVDPTDQDRLVPVGAVGELVVAGPSLAKEYLNNEAKTKASFINGLAWAKSMGMKERTFFKTGDLLRYNTDTMDGSCDFMRRKDTQIKLHGQRIEAGDVECGLLKLPAVAVAVVVLPKQGCFAGELVAVLQMSSSKAPRFSNKPISLGLQSLLDEETVRVFLERNLPDYMVPKGYLVIASMPVNQSGKIDRKAIISWVSSLKTRPFAASVGFARKSDILPLNAQEITAHALSRKVADFVCLKDEVRGFVLLGHDFNLLDAGLSSIQMIQLLMFMRTFGVQCPVNKLWSSRTRIRDLAYMIDHWSSEPDGANSGDVDCFQEYGLYEQDLLHDQEPGPPMLKDALVSNILVTGASGFLGLRILQNLLIRSCCNIFALIRCQTPSEGLSRVIACAKRQGWWSSDYESRLHIWPGDLSQPKFGLSEPSLESLGGLNPDRYPSINAIIHNAAHIHYNLAFDALKAANTTPVLSLLKTLARSPYILSFVYVSGGTNPLVERVGIEEQAKRANRTNGYGQTKFVAEALVRRCTEHVAFEEKMVHIVKPGYIMGGVDGDEPNKADFLWRLIAASLEIKACDQAEADKWLYISDVEHIAGRVVDSVLPHAGLGNVDLNVLDGLRCRELWDILKEEFGYELNPLSSGEWRERLEDKIAEKGEEHVLFPFIHRLRGNTLSVGEEIGPDRGMVGERVKKAVRWNVWRLVQGGFFPSAKLL